MLRLRVEVVAARLDFMERYQGPRLFVATVVLLARHYGEPTIGTWDPFGIIASLALAVGGLLLGGWTARGTCGPSGLEPLTEYGVLVSQSLSIEKQLETIRREKAEAETEDLWDRA